MIIPLIVMVLMIAGLWKVYSKAGKPGWASIVPIYNLIVWIQIVKKPLWWIILCCIPLVNLYPAVVMTHRISRSFGKGVGTTIGLIFLPYVFYPMLGFGSAKFTELKD